ncbi:bud emergence protein 1 [Dinochytrium kinnereticum]|nr:bud emergence protein 1 [Dinochytrium kinnereticum]
MAYGGSSARNFDRDTLYTQYMPQGAQMDRSPSAAGSPYYDDPRSQREERGYYGGGGGRGGDEYDDDRSYRSPSAAGFGGGRVSPYEQRHPPSEYFDDQASYQQYPQSGNGYRQEPQQQQSYSRGGPGYDNGSSMTSPPPLTSSSTISSTASQYAQQQYRSQQQYPTPSQSASSSPGRAMGQNGNAPSPRRAPVNAGGARGAPPGFKIEGGALVPIIPRGSSHPTEIFYQPPKKVIRAMSDYVARSGNELTFYKGDFFYVVNENDRYYEVVNPLEKSRGTVPKNCFEGLEEMQARTLANARAAAGMTHTDIGDHFFPGMDDLPPVSASPSSNFPPPTAGVPNRHMPTVNRGPPEIIKPNADGFYVPKYPPQQSSTPPSASPLPSAAYSPNVRNLPTPSSPSVPVTRQPTSASPVSPGRGGDLYQGAPSPSYGKVLSPGQSQPRARSQSPNGNPNLVLHAIIHEMELREDGRYWYAVEIERGTGERSLLNRTFDDFWALQVALLNHFPAESGRRPGIPRTIPFLPSPAQNGPTKDRDLTPAGAKERKQMLATYLSEFVRLPPALIESPQARRFFQVRQPVGDVFSLAELDDALPDIGDGRNRAGSPTSSSGRRPSAAAIKAVTDVGGTVMDLIENYNDKPRGGPPLSPDGSYQGREYPDDDFDPDVPYEDQAFSPGPISPLDSSMRVKVNLGDEMLAFRIPDAMVSYRDLVYEVEDRMLAVGALPEDSPGLNGLSYKDECGMLVPLCGDDDLRLLFRTLPQKLVFFPR